MRVAVWEKSVFDAFAGAGVEGGAFELGAGQFAAYCYYFGLFVFLMVVIL